MFQPRYSIADAFLLRISNIERLTAKLNTLTIPKEVLEHIKKQCKVALTHFSTQIEGNQLSMEQVSGVVEQNKKYGMKRDEREVKNYFNLLEQIPSFIKQFKGEISKELILNCHTFVEKGIVEDKMLGNFREVQNAIYEAGTNRLVYLPPEPKDVLDLVESLCEWVNTTKIHPILLAAIFHNQFITIHPFIDGNGRVARIISLYMLDSHGYLWKEIVPIDRYYASDRGRYYSMLQSEYSHNYYEGRANADFSEWIDYYAQGIEKILEKTINQAQLYCKQNILLNNRQEKIINYLESNPFITAQQYAHKFEISTRMASRDLKQLVEWEKLAVIGKARSTKYISK